MGVGARVVVEGEFNLANVNRAFAKLSERVDRLEGKSESTNRTEPLNIEAGKGKGLLAGGFSLNLHGDDLESASLAKGAYMGEDGQWYASLTQATILEFNGSSNVKIYTNTGLTPGVAFTPTLDTTVT